MSNKEWDRKSYAQSEALNALHESDDTEVGKTSIDWIIEAVDITKNDLIVVAEDIDVIVLESTYNEKDERGVPVGFSYSTEVLVKLVALEGLLIQAAHQLHILQGLLETGDEQEFINLWSTPL